MNQLVNVLTSTAPRTLTSLLRWYVTLQFIVSTGITIAFFMQEDSVTWPQVFGGVIMFFVGGTMATAIPVAIACGVLFVLFGGLTR
jgi:hypothetical protein